MANTSDYFSIEGQDPDSYIASNSEVLIVALDEHDRVYLTIEPSPAFDGQPVLVLPGGTTSPAEAPEATANRELQEEVGLRGERISLMGEVWRWAKYLNVRTHICLARDLSPSKLDGDEHYEITTETVALDQFDELIASGRLRDAATIAALYMARAVVAGEHTTP